MNVVTVGIDTEFIDAIREVGHDAVAVDGFGREALLGAGTEEADAVVVGKGYATQVVVAKEINPDARVVVVADDVPEFISGNADLILSTELSDRLPEALETEDGTDEDEV